MEFPLSDGEVVFSSFQIFGLDKSYSPGSSFPGKSERAFPSLWMLMARMIVSL
jgi:hypothetical protein